MLPLVVSAVAVRVVAPDFTVISVRSTVPMASLNARTIFVPSLELPALSSVGRTPSTLWFAEAATAACSRTASGLSPAEALIVPPLRVSLFAATARPSVSSSLAATVYPVNTSAFEPLPEP